MIPHSIDLVPPTPMPDSYPDIPSIERWIVAHDTRCQAWWEEQRRMNVRIEARMESHSMRISAVERRVMWLAGVAAAGGAVVGQAVSAFIM